MQLASRYYLAKENEAELSLPPEIPDATDDSLFVEATWPTGDPYKLPITIGKRSEHNRSR